MIQLTAPSRALTTPLDKPPEKPAADGASAVTMPFAQSLASFLDASAPDPAVAPATPERQDTADGGSDLPAGDHRHDDPDAALAWLIAPPPVSPTAPPLRLAGATPAPPPIQPLAPDLEAAAAPLPAAAVTNPGGGVIGDPTVMPAMTDDAHLAKATIDAARPVLVTARDPEIRVAIVAGLAPPPVQPLQPSPAGEVFAAAIQAASEPGRPVARHAVDDPAVSPLQPTTAVDTARHAVAATGDTQQAPLDMGQRHWPQAMIDRIEALRDQADAADTRIRLVPDALGAIDVAMRRDGDTVHVHFAADQAGTRAILSDAQPTLTALAESRGIRLTQTSVDAGGAGADRQPAAQWQPQSPTRPATARVDNPASPDADTRVA